MPIEFGEDYIRIYEEGMAPDEDIVYWTHEEWKEDPDVVFSIANAVRIASTHGTRYLKDMLEGRILVEVAKTRGTFPAAGEVQVRRYGRRRR